MKLCQAFVILLGLFLRLPAREIDLRLWISGGMQGVVLGNRDCPGWLSVSRQLALEDPEGCWIQLGVPPVGSDIEGLKNPDAVVPTEADFRLQGVTEIEALPASMGLLNVKNLPQFPDYRPGFASVQVWRQADGVEVHVFGLLSDRAPLRIPPDRLRPLQVTPGLDAIRNYVSEHPFPDNVLPVLVLPEDADPAVWSDWLPDFPLLIQPAGTQAKTIEVNNGRQLRVQPARFGRALIRVQVYWDTVERRFRNPTAETVWVHPPTLHGLDLPPEIQTRLRPLTGPPAGDWREVLMQHGDAALLPPDQAMAIDSSLPDARRVAAFPEDHAWLRVRGDNALWKKWVASWQGPSLNRLDDAPEQGGWILLTAEMAAGNGDPASVIRKDLDTREWITEWLPFSSRDLAQPLEEAGP